MLEITDHNLKDCRVCKSSPVVVEIYVYLAVCSCRDPWWDLTMSRLEQAWKRREAYLKKHRIKKMIGG